MSDEKLVVALFDPIGKIDGQPVQPTPEFAELLQKIVDRLESHDARLIELEE